MHRNGHLGVSMLLFVPIGHWLVTNGHPGLAALTGFSMLWLVMLPDIDQRLPGIPHRGPTHSLLFAVAVGVVFGLVFESVGAALSLSTPGTVREFGFFVGAVTVVAHLAGDVITPMGVNFLWPLDWSPSLGVTSADSAIWNYGLLLAGGTANVAVFGQLLGVF